MDGLTWKKILAGVVLVVSCLVVAVSLAGIIGLWYFNSPAKSSINQAFAPVNQAVDTLSPAVTETEQNLEQISQRLTTIESNLRSLAEKPAEESGPLVTEIERIQAEIVQRLETAQANFAKAKENHPKLVAAVALAKNVPLFAPKEPENSRLVQLEQRIAEFRQNWQELQNAVKEASAQSIANNTRTQVLTTAANRVESANQRVETANTAIDSYNAQVTAIKTLNNNLILAIDAISVLTTILLLGLALAQYYLIEKSWDYLKKPAQKRKR